MILLALHFLALSDSCESQARVQDPKLLCQTLDIARAIHEQDYSGPKVLYHVGTWDHIMDNYEVQGIPKKVWDRHIMPGTLHKTKWKLGPVRQGLYGATSPVSLWGDGWIKDWYMEIHIKDECRSPKHIATDMLLKDSKRFERWYKSTQTHLSLAQWLKSCKIQNGGIPFNHRGEPDRCAQVVLDYYNDENILMVQDTGANHSWYLRSAHCIEKIVATADEWWELLKTSQRLFPNECDNQSGLNATFLRRLVQTGLYRKFTLDELEAIRKNVETHAHEFARSAWNEELEDARRFAKDCKKDCQVVRYSDWLHQVEGVPATQ